MNHPKFFTRLPQLSSKFNLDYSYQVSLWGSCFAENMHEFLARAGFRVHSNPYGIIYNPVSIARLFQVIDNNKLDEFPICKREDFYTSWFTHSSFNQLSSKGLHSQFEMTRASLLSTYKNNPHVFIISLGSAWVYEHVQEGIIVANCHKYPKSTFEKRLLKIEEIRQSLTEMRDKVTAWNPKNQVIFTISPVRHLRDGFIENNRSKARLIEAIHQLIEDQKWNNAHYFPSFELLMDELRDYRFYAEDLVHPNSIAIQVIWSKFIETYCSKNQTEMIQKANSYYKIKNHRVLSSSLEAVEQHRSKVKSLKEELLNTWPNMHLS